MSGHRSPAGHDAIRPVALALAVQLEAAPAIEGSLEVVSLGTLLAVFELERRSGIVRLARAGTPVARVLLREGRPVQARLGQQRGREALLEVLDWREGHFDFTPALVDVADEIESPISWLLLEAARRHDESESESEREREPGQLAY